MRSYVYAGVSARSGGTDEDGWVHATIGMPDDAHVHPDAATLFAATKAGQFRSPEHGGRWTCRVELPPREQMWSVLVHPSRRLWVMTP